MTTRITAFALLAALCLPGGATLAQTTEPAYAIEDQVLLNLSAEMWVETASPKVIITLNAARAEANGTEVRTEMRGLLAELGTPAEGETWRMLSFDESRDNTGLTRWSATAETRLTAEVLDGLADRVQAAGRAGMQLRLNQIDFSPTLSEMEAARAELRFRIYGQAAQEISALEAVFEDRDFRMGRVDFLGGAYAPSPAPMARMEMAVASADMVSIPGGAGAVSRKMVLDAHVMVSSTFVTTGE